MAAPDSNRPSKIKDLIPAIGGGFCEKFLKFLTGFAQAFFDLISYMFTEGGAITPEFKTDLCALGCLNSGDGGTTEPPNPNMPAPQNVFATDNAFADKINISWDAVTAPTGIAAVTQYKLYRSTTNNFGNAVLIATVAAPTVSYDDVVDGDLMAGTNYWYWVRATNGADTSSISNRDQGRAASGGDIGVLDDVTDLLATQGFSVSAGGVISLVWTAPAGATKYDIWRHTANVFSAATKIHSAMVPETPEDQIGATTSPDSLWDNGDSILFWHAPPLPTVHYFFWVVAKADSPPAVSGESNPAEGWVQTNYAPYTGGIVSLSRGETLTEGIDFTGTHIRVVLTGGGGGGAGGSQVYGGGGGGGGGTVVEEFVIAPGDVLGLIASPDVDDTGNAAALADGGDGSSVEFQINGVTKMMALEGRGGKFSASGGGLGGDGETGSGTATPTIYDGKPGLPGAGALGGATGYHFGNRRYPGAHFNGFSGFGSWTGDGSGFGGSGGGSKASPGAEVLATGGKGTTGFCVIAFGT